MIFWYYSELVTDWLRLLVVVMLLYGPECRAIWAIGHRVATTGGETTPIHETMPGEYLKNGRWRSLGKMVEVCCTSVLLNTFNLAKDYAKTLKLRLRVLGPARKKKKVYQLSRGGRRCTDVP